MSKIQTALNEGMKACKELFERDYFGNHTIKLSDFEPIKKRFERAEQEEQKLRKEIDELRSRISGLEAARIAYASEFEPNVEGKPDVGSIHQNIRNLKRELAHQKANHVDLKERLHVATHRTDLPSDRLPLFDKLKADTVRMNYLESMCVEVRTPLRHGSQSLFHAQTVSDDEDPHKNDIRDQIDRHMKNKS